MAKLEEITEIMATMSLVYPKYELTKAAIKVYSESLKDLPCDVLTAASKEIMNTSVFFPSLAEWRNKAIDLMLGAHNIPSAYEAYQEVTTLAFTEKRIFGEKPDDDGTWHYKTFSYKWSHPLVEKAAQQIGWPYTFPTDNPTADRPQFFRVYEELLRREIEKIRMLPESKRVSQKYAQLSGGVKMLEDE